VPSSWANKKMFHSFLGGKKIPSQPRENQGMKKHTLIFKAKTEKHREGFSAS